MKQKNTAIGKAFLCGSAAMLLLAGCVKESAINEKYRPAGTPITFSAATGYENGTGTRTEYSGQLYGSTPKYERIDWLSGDPVTITYVHGTPATSQYQVTEVSGTTDRNSLASVEVSSGQPKLTWGEGDGDHTFYAMYPSTGFQGNGSASLTSSNHVQGSVPATQTLHLSADGTKYLPPMQYGYMVAYKNISGTSTENRVTLPFTPAVTAFEFKLQKRTGDTGNLKIKGAELTATTPLTGSFAFDITGGDDNGATWNTSIGTNATTVTNGGHTVSFTFPVEGGVSLPDYGGETFLDFTVFALPVEQTGLTLKLIYTDDSHNTLTLNDSPGVPHIFEAARKHVITNKSVPGDWEYVIEATDPDIFPYTGGTKNATVTSYRQKGNVKEPVAWTVEGYYYDAACTQPVDPADLWIISFGTNGTGEGSVTGATVPVVGQPSIPVMTETITPEAQALNALIANAPAKGSAGNYWNLSNPATGGDHIVESANSYIINATGYYRIPLVMGNSIKNNAPNPDEIAWKGFDGAAVDGGVYKNDWRVLFENYKGNHITDPWLKNQGGTPTSAEIVWEDVEGLVETDDTYNLENAISSDGNWLQFQIPAVRTGAGVIGNGNEPRQGNAVIAVKDETGTVMWSYHIWVTDYVPKNYPGYQTTNDSDITGLHFYFKEGNHYLIDKQLKSRWMNPNLGWVVYGQRLNTLYPASTVYLKLSQTTSGLATTIQIRQEEHQEVYPRDWAAPTYQYGRIVPTWPADRAHGNDNSWYFYGKNPSFNSVQGPLTLSESIRQPGKGILCDGSPHLSVISVSHPDPYVNSMGQTVEWFPNLSTTTTMPMNLWDNSCRLPFDTELMMTTSADHRWIIFTPGLVFSRAPKSVYDPCPVGYRVPSHVELYLFTDSAPLLRNQTFQNLTWGIVGNYSTGRPANSVEDKYVFVPVSSQGSSMVAPVSRVTTLMCSNGNVFTSERYQSLFNQTSRLAFSMPNYSEPTPMMMGIDRNISNSFYLGFSTRLSMAIPIKPVDDVFSMDGYFPTEETNYDDYAAVVNQ